MKKCPKCGQMMDDNARFCSVCGLEMADVKPENESTEDRADEGAAAGKEQFHKATNNNQGGFSQEQSRQVPPLNQYRPPYQTYDPKDHTSEFDPADIADNKLFAALPYFLGLAGVIAALLVQGSPYTRFHIKNEIRFLIASILACIPLLVPVLGWIVCGLALTVIGVLKIVAMVEVLQGKAKEIPIISNISFLR